MFCSNCGYELSEGVQFCSKCGKKIITEVTTVKDDEFERNAPVSAEFENITVENQFSERVNSELFANRKSQNKLFSVYAELIEPVKRIEELTQKANACNAKMEYLRDENNAEIKHGCLSKVVGIAVGILLGAVVAIPIIKVNFLLGWLIAFIGMPCLSVVLCRMIWKGTYGQFYKKRKYKENLAEAERLENIRDDLLKERDAICLAEKDKLMYVPKKYRYSEAIEYFVEQYNSTRVDTLKEAVNVYVHDKQEAVKLEQIMSKINEVIGYLSSVEERL